MAEQTSAVGSISPLSGSGVAELVLGLGFVIVLIFALAWAYRRFAGAGLGVGGLIRVVAAMSLGNRDRIALISVGEKQLLIGISPGRITTLHVFDQAPEPAPTGQAAPAKAANSEFQQKLQKMLTGNKS